MIKLPKDKLTNWLFDIKNTLKNKSTSLQTFESIIGRLNHASFIIPFGRFFLSRLRFRLKCARSRKYKFVKLQEMEIQDLLLWIELLKYASSSGININHITFTHPSFIGLSDSCKLGIGGFILGGPGWRYRLPDDLIGFFSINYLEFIGSILTFEFAIFHARKQDIPHRGLLFTDSTSALGWLFKSTFDPLSQPCHDKVAREFARIGYKNNTSLFSQHIEGKKNFIADALSRDFHLSDQELTKIIHSHLPTQDRSHFKILTHPRKIDSWL